MAQHISPTSPPSCPSWVFANVLYDVLAEQGVRFGTLVTRCQTIPKYQVDRLRVCLYQTIPTALPILSQEQIEEAREVLDLTRDQALRLWAAVLTTGVARILLDHANQDKALRIIESIASEILDAVRRNTEVLRWGGVAMAEEAAELIQTLMPTFEALDRAMLALQLSQHAESPIERTLQAHYARQGFAQALKDLYEAPPAVRAQMEWHEIHQDVTQRLQAAEQRIRALS